MAQCKNSDFFYKGRPYRLASREQRLTLPLEEYGISLDCKGSLTGTGTITEFAITDGLYLKNVGISSLNGNFPLINGVSPCSEVGNYAFYADVNLKLDYTGGLLLGRKSNAFHSYKKDSQWPWAFHELMEFTFEHGNLVAVKNQNRLARKLYNQMNDLCDTPEEYEYIREVDYSALSTSIQLLLLDFPMPAWWVDDHTEETLEERLGLSEEDLDELAELFAKSLDVTTEADEGDTTP